METATKTPTPKQWTLLKAVHERCKLEFAAEEADATDKCPHEPVRLFCHGLPGSGKTTVMRWLKSYFEQVWRWEHKVHFIFLAPMNTMAARLDGDTIHSWGEIQWEAKGPQGSFKLG